MTGSDGSVKGSCRSSTTGLAIDLSAGEHLGLVITDPAGAASLLDVLGREVEPDGTAASTEPICARYLDDARRAVLVARHDAALFEGTLRENYTATARSSGALAASAADEVVDVMPDGFDTEIGERGVRSPAASGSGSPGPGSGGGATVLVLHDPTTAIDAATEDRVAAGLRTSRRAQHAAGHLEPRVAGTLRPGAAGDRRHRRGRGYPRTTLVEGSRTTARRCCQRATPAPKSPCCRSRPPGGPGPRRGPCSATTVACSAATITMLLASGVAVVFVPALLGRLVDVVT